MCDCRGRRQPFFRETYVRRLLRLMSLLCGLRVDEGVYLGTHVPSALTMTARRTLGVYDIASYLSSATAPKEG